MTGRGRPAAPARRLAGLLAAAAALSLALAGCFDEPAVSAPPTPTRPPEPTPITTAYDLGATVWYEGLVIHLDRAVSVLDQRGGPVTVDVRVDNPGIDPVELDAKIVLVVGEALVEANRESRLEQVQPGASVTGTMTYELQGITSVDDAVLEIGAAPSHVGRVPLTEAGGERVTLEPREFELRGSGTAGNLRLTLRSGVQRWDLADWYQELPADRQVVTVRYDATFTGGFSGGFPFTEDNVALRLPDGTNVAPRKDGHSQSVELIGPGRTKADLFSRFELPASVTGDVNLVVIDGAATRTIAVTIPG